MVFALVGGIVLTFLYNIFPRIFAVVALLLLFLVFIPVLGGSITTGFLPSVLCSALSNFDLCTYRSVTGAQPL